MLLPTNQVRKSSFLTETSLHRLKLPGIKTLIWRFYILKTNIPIWFWNFWSLTALLKMKNYFQQVTLLGQVLPEKQLLLTADLKLSDNQNTSLSHMFIRI